MIHTNPILAAGYNQSHWPGIDFSDLGVMVEAAANARAQQAFNDLIAKHAHEADRAKVRSSAEMAERYGLTIKRIQALTRGRVLPAQRPKGLRKHWSYLTGACDDALAKMRRPDGMIKGSWRREAKTKKAV